MWFRVSAGRQKKAEARWLLPMICRRGGIEKNDIGAIKIYENHSEFEISGEAAEQFLVKIKRPDKEQHVIAQLPGGPQGETQVEAAPVNSAKPVPNKASLMSVSRLWPSGTKVSHLRPGYRTANLHEVKATGSQAVRAQAFRKQAL